ncbi:MAG: hypothetical protein K0S67_95, partial [Nitrososphaeraceae archaeon]|nr:hypothetical protein [Nitrososphaeraceae archaeon]MDF2768565.1 hypothetical protein [Nitrososphaeraceae archaeon]
CGICHAVVVITTEAIAIATEIAGSAFLLTIFFTFVVLIILIKRTKFSYNPCLPMKRN